MQLYRYLEKQYVERFFDTGCLMLSSFERCRELEDARGDQREGNANFFIATPNRSIAGMFGAGANTRLLCTSRNLTEHLMRKFGTDDYFIIRRPAHFAHVIGQCLEGAISIHYGDCSYADDGFETTSTESFFCPPPNLENLSEADAINWAESEWSKMSERLGAALGDRGIFTKRYAAYHDEAEYRFAWTLGKPVNGLTLVICPDAVRYCKRS